MMPTITQSISFKKQYWTVKRAKKWLKENGYKGLIVDETKNFYRFRQIDPEEFRQSSFRTIYFKPTIMALIGEPMKKRKNSRRQDDFIQTAFEEIDKDGTEGAFTRYVANNFYGENTPQKRKAVAQQIKAEYEKWVKKGKKGNAPFTLKTYKRAVFYLNIQRHRR
jgi:hypothetical protein